MGYFYYLLVNLGLYICSSNFLEYKLCKWLYFSTKENDVCILRLASAAEINENVQTIRLPQQLHEDSGRLHFRYLQYNLLGYIWEIFYI